MADSAPTASISAEAEAWHASQQINSPASPTPTKRSNIVLLSQVLCGVAGLCLVFVIASLAINPHQRQIEAENQLRQKQLSELQQALERYAARHQGTYPSTNGEYWCDDCSYAEYKAKGADEWIPDLVDENFIAMLPTDPAGLKGTTCRPKDGQSFAGYVYYSPAPPYNTDYKVFAQCSPPSYALNYGVAAPKQDYCSARPPYDSSKLTANPFRDTALKPYVDPARYEYGYAIYSAGLACL